jgi:hypothetical protein
MFVRDGRYFCSIIFFCYFLMLIVDDAFVAVQFPLFHKRTGNFVFIRTEYCYRQQVLKMSVTNGRVSSSELRKSSSESKDWEFMGWFTPSPALDKLRP